MKAILLRRVVLFFVIASFVLVSPEMILAGGFKDKLQQRLNTQSNINFQQEYYAPQTSQTIQYDQGGSDQIIRPRGGAVQVSSQRLLEADLEVPQESTILSPYAIYQTNYKAELEENVVTVSGKVVFEVFQLNGWTQIPLVSSSVGLIDVSVNRKSSFIIMQGGKYYLMIDRPGRYNLDVEFLIKASREREGGPGNFNVEVLPAPISQFEFTMPEQNVQIFIEPAIKVEVKEEPKQTVAWAVMPNTPRITVRWTKALPKEIITPVKLEPKIHADTSTNVSVGEGIMHCQTTLNYSILQSEISNIRVALPEDVSVLDVSGRELRDWKISQKDGIQYLDVFLNFGIKGNYLLNLVFERNIGEGSVVAQVPEVIALDVEREKGYYGIAATTNVELEATEIEGASEIDVKELPSSMWSSSENPILLAFKYLKHPVDITIEVTRHEEIPVLVAAVDSVNYVTLYTGEGKSLTKATYQVRNNVKQFIRIELPKDSILWSTFVAGKPVKPAKDKDGNILIPLQKSQLQGESLTRFPVEVVYLDKFKKMNFVGQLKLNLPKVDIPISEFYWSVYLPLDHAYFNFGGDVRQVTSKSHGAGLGLLRSGVQSVAGRMDQYAREEKAVYDQYSSKKGRLTQRKGVLPIKIDIPQQGRFLRFSKLLVTEKESPWLSVNYFGLSERLRGWLKFLSFCAVIIFIILMIKKVARKAHGVLGAFL